jgi:hypothetical protein
MSTIALPTALITLTALFLSPVAGRPAEEESPAVAAARVRQEAVKTLYVEYKRTEVIPKGYLSDFYGDLLKQKAPLPDKEFTGESINRIVIDGEKLREENNHPLWANLYSPNGGFSEWSSVYVSDGTTVKQLYPKGNASGREQGNPWGGISSKPRLELPFVMSPIKMAFRGLSHPNYISRMKPTGNILPIDWAPCPEYAITSSTGTDHFWLDPEKDYVMRRRKWANMQIDIRYRRDDTWGWVPESWVQNAYWLNGVLQSTNRVDVLDMRINEPQPAELFDIEFPPGCVVQDGRTTSPKVYRVLPDGNMHEVSERTGEPLPKTKVQPAGAWYWRYRWLLAGAGVILAGLAWQYAVRRKRANAA